MLALGLRFPSGRFHATPWGRHVNEGTPEWPPSPWRLLRSLVATWRVKAPELAEEQVRPVLEALASPPCFCLPPATIGHSRHYMRWYKKGPEDQTLVFDAFVSVDRSSEVVLLWPDVQLGDGQDEVLKVMLDRLGYLGRGESWCEARLLSEKEALLAVPNCGPAEGAEAERGKELVRVLCADQETAFGDEHVRPVGARRTRGRSARPPYNPVWHLCIETAQLHTEKWSDPPGSRWVTYARSADCFRPQGARPASRPVPVVQVARYLLDSSVLPLVTESLPIAEQVRAKLMGIYGRITESNGVKGRSAAFSGKDPEGQLLTGHGHAYYLPADEDGDGRLDHLTVIAQSGLNRSEVRALDGLRTLTRGAELPEIKLVLIGLGRIEEFRSAPLREARTWVSATPFLVTRYPKKNGRKRDRDDVLQDPHAFVEQVLREELQRFCEVRLLEWTAEAISIQRVYDPPGVFRIRPREWIARAGGADLRPIQFKRYRSRKTDDDGGRRWSGAFRICFPAPVRGPICLGHSCHFGLGLFLPASTG